MDVGKAFRYIFEDPNWMNKVLIGSLLGLVSFVLSPLLVGLLGFFILAGYSLEVLRNVREERIQVLPEWKDRWGEWLVLGLKLAVATFVWALPGLLLNAVAGIGNAIAQGGGGAEPVGAIIAVCFGCLAILWYLVVALVSPAIYVRLAETERLSSAFRFADILAFTRDNLGEVLIAVIVSWVVGLVLLLVGLIAGTVLCLVGLVITLPAAGFVSSLIQVHLYGQIGRSAASDWQSGANTSRVSPTKPVTAVDEEEA